MIVVARGRAGATSGRYVATTSSARERTLVVVVAAGAPAGDDSLWNGRLSPVYCPLS